jgi:hypothetical protein
MSKKTIEERMAEAEKKLQQLKAQANLKKRRERTQAAAKEKRQRLADAVAISRQADAHRKIELGGVVIAAAADGLDAAELCGALLAYMERRNPEAGAQFRERGLAHFEARKKERPKR